MEQKSEKQTDAKGKKSKDLSSGATLTLAIVASITLGLTIGSYVRQSKIDSLQEQIAMYNNFKELNLPVVLQRLDSTTVVINKNLHELRLVTEYREMNARLQASLDSMQAVSDSLVAENVEQKTRIAALLGESQTLRRSFVAVNARKESFKLKEGEVRKLIKNQHPLGILRIDTTSVTFNFDNTRDTMMIGDQKLLSMGGVTGTLTLMKIDKPSDSNRKCYFEFVLHEGGEGSPAFREGR